jgi:hypothetical protein
MKTQNKEKNSLQRTISEFLRKVRKKFKHGVSQFWKKFKHAVDQFMNLLFNTTKLGGDVRRWTFIIISAMIWALAAYVNKPPALGDDFFADFINYPFEALFHPEVFRHVLVSGLTFWLAIQIAASYLDDVFELGDPKIAESYILKASLANRYQRIEIKEGKISGKDDSTIVRIGGPGLVRVHYDSAVLFEKINGEPTVLTSEDGLIALDRFERLRKTVLLRDHIDETPIEAHTRDGIAVGANGLRIKFFIHRNEPKPEKIEEDKKKDKDKSKIPYPIVRSAVMKLVYDEKVTKWINPISLKSEDEDKPPDVPHPEALEITSYPIREKFRSFIAQRTLGEFLATISDVELKKREEESQDLKTGAMHLTGEIPIEPKPDEEKEKTTIKGKFFSRDEITEMMYEGNDQQDKLKTGIELDWIDIGTWNLPANAQQIFEQHQEAWELSLENISNRSSKEEKKVKLGNKVKTLQKFLQDFVLEFETHRYSRKKSETTQLLLNFYYQMLLQAQGIYRKHPDHKAAPISLGRVNNHLNRLLGRGRDPSGRP